MGNRGHNRRGPKREAATVPLSRGELGLRLTQCGLGWGLLLYQVASSSIQLFGHNGHGPKIGGSAPLVEAELGPHLTQCRLGWGLPQYQVWYPGESSHLTTIDMGRKLGRGLAGPPFLGGLGPHLTQCRLGRDIPPYQVASWSIQLFGHNRYGLKIRGCAPLGEGSWV